RDWNRSGDWRTDHASVQHAGQLYVHHVVERAEHLRSDVAPRRPGLADDLVFARRLWLGLAGDEELVAEMLVPFERHVEVTAADELAVGDLFAGVVLVADDTIRDGQAVNRHGELLRRHLDKHTPRFGGGVAKCSARAPDAGRAGGAALVDREVG